VDTSAYWVLDGSNVGIAESTALGRLVGMIDRDGLLDERKDGLTLGFTVGIFDGFRLVLGMYDGLAIGADEGRLVG